MKWVKVFQFTLILFFIPALTTALNVTAPEIKNVQFYCLWNSSKGYLVFGENVTLYSTVTPSSASNETDVVSFVIEANGTTYATFEATYNGAWQYSGKLYEDNENIKCTEGGLFNITAYVKRYDADTGALIATAQNSTVAKIYHILKIASPIYIKKSSLNPRENESIRVTFKNRIETQDITCPSYNLGVNATVVYNIIDRLSNVFTINSGTFPIKPNKSEWFSSLWDTTNAKVDQNHTVVATVNYSNDYYGIDNIKLGCINLSNYTSAFYVFPIKAYTKVYYKGAEANIVPNGSNINVSIYTYNLGYDNVTANITVKLYFDNGTLFKAQNKTVNIKRRHGDPLLTAISFDFKLSSEIINYTINTNISYINPDPNFMALVKNTYNISIATWNRTYANIVQGVQVTGGTFNRTVYSTKPYSVRRRVELKYNITSVDDPHKALLITRFYVGNITDNYPDTPPEKGTLLFEDSRNVTVEYGNNKYEPVFWSNDIVNPPFNELLLWRPFYIEMTLIPYNSSYPTFNFETWTYPDYGFPPYRVRFDKPETTVFSPFDEKQLMVSILEPYDKAFEGSGSPVKGASVSYRAWDSRGTVISDGTLQESVEGRYETAPDTPFKLSCKNGIAEGSMIVEVYGTQEGEDFWSFHEYEVSHPIKIEELNLSQYSVYPGDTLNVTMLVNNTDSYMYNVTARGYATSVYGSKEYEGEGENTTLWPLNDGNGKWTKNLTIIFDTTDMSELYSGNYTLSLFIDYINTSSSKSCSVHTTSTFYLEKAGFVNLSVKENLLSGERVKVYVKLKSAYNDELEGNLSLYLNGTSEYIVKNESITLPSLGEVEREYNWTVPSNLSGKYTVIALFNTGSFSTEKKKIVDIETASLVSLAPTYREIYSGGDCNDIISVKANISVDITLNLTLQLYGKEGDLVYEFQKKNVSGAKIAEKNFEWNGLLNDGKMLPEGNYTLVASLLYGNTTLDSINSSLELVNLTILNISAEDEVVNGETVNLTVFLRNNVFDNTTAINYKGVAFLIYSQNTLYKVFNYTEYSSLSFSSNPLLGKEYTYNEQSYSVTWVVSDFNGNPLPPGNYTIEARVYYGVCKKETLTSNLTVKKSKFNKTIYPNKTSVVPYEKFKVTAIITNLGTTNATANSVTLIPPPSPPYPEIVIVSQNPVNLGIIEPGKNKTANWTVYAKDAGDVPYFNVTILYDGEYVDPSSEGISVKNNYNLTIITSSQLYTNAKFTVQVNVSNDIVEVNDVNVSLETNCSVLSSKTAYVGKLSKYEHKLVNFTLKCNTTCGNITVLSNYTVENDTKNVSNSTLIYLKEGAVLSISAAYPYSTKSVLPFILSATVNNSGSADANNTVLSLYLPANMTANSTNYTANISKNSTEIFYFNVTPLDCGTYIFNLSANCTNCANASKSYSIFICDNIAPSIDIISPNDGATYNHSDIELNYTTNETVVWCGYSLDGTEFNTVSGNITVNVKGGSHILTLKCNDSAGNYGSSSVSFSVIYCGDGICQSGENSENCPADCKQEVETTAGGGGMAIIPPPSSIELSTDLYGTFPSEYSAFRGKKRTLKLEIKNTGDKLIGALSVSVLGIPESWYTTYCIEDGRKVREIENILNKATCYIEFQIPKDASKGEYHATVEIKTTEGVPYREEFTLYVKDYPEIYSTPLNFNLSERVFTSKAYKKSETAIISDKDFKSVVVGALYSIKGGYPVITAKSTADYLNAKNGIGINVKPSDFGLKEITTLNGSAYAIVSDVARSLYPNGAKNVIVARSDLFPDSIVAISLAKAVDSPILFTENNRLPNVIKETIKQLNPERVIIIGGEKAVSKDVENSFDVPVLRLGGADRSETSLIVANYIGKFDGIIISDFNTNLSISCVSLMAKEGYPLVFTKDGITDDVATLLRRVSPDKIYIISDSSRVKEEVEGVFE